MELNPNHFTILILFVFALPLSYFDIRYQRLPLGFTLPALTVSLIFRVSQADTINYIIAGVLGFIFIYIVRFITRQGIGMGDALISALLGLLLGFRFWLAAILAGTVLALLISLILLGIKKIDRKTRIPFAPFLFAGGILIILRELI